MAKMTETDLISRQAAIDALYDWSNHTITDAEAWHLRQVIGYIKSMPSAQPEIIRCKDCLWRIGRDCTRFTDLPVYMDDYCGRAKRRGEQDETD